MLTDIEVSVQGDVLNAGHGVGRPQTVHVEHELPLSTHVLVCDGHRVPLPVIVALVLRGDGVDGLVAWSVQLGKIEKKKEIDNEINDNNCNDTYRNSDNNYYKR